MKYYAPALSRYQIVTLLTRQIFFQNKFMVAIPDPFDGQQVLHGRSTN